MITLELIDKSLALISEALEIACNPVVACSFGKDSMVMLHLVRQVKSDIPVLHFRGFDHLTKHAFADSVIESWSLNTIQPKPYAVDVLGRGDHIELIDVYRLTDSTVFYYPIEAEPNYIPNEDSLCAIQRLNSPTDDKPLGFDLIVIGHRDDDGDHTHGAVPLQSDRVESGGITAAYPLKNWTEANIWEASDLMGIPQDDARYKRRDMAANADYFPLCAECLKPTDSESIICPKINEPVFAIGKFLNLEERREQWRNKFVNISNERHNSSN